MTDHYEEDYDGSLQEDYYLVLNEDGTVQFEAVKIAHPADASVVARGTWVRDGAGVLIEADEFSGQALAQPETIRYEYRDGFPIATDYQADGKLYNLAEAEFTIGAGERHPLARELHQRLATVDYLGFTDPGDDLFTEVTRRAVVAFQESQGLLPNGEVSPATWVLLMLRPYFTVLIVSLISVIILKPTYNFFLQRKWVKQRKGLASSLTLGAVLVMLVIPVVLIVWLTTSQLSGMFTQLAALDFNALLQDIHELLAGLPLLGDTQLTHTEITARARPIVSAMAQAVALFAVKW
jgi:hypothetical protein